MVTLSVSFYSGPILHLICHVSLGRFVLVQRIVFVVCWFWYCGVCFCWWFSSSDVYVSESSSLPLVPYFDGSWIVLPMLIVSFHLSLFNVRWRNSGTWRTLIVLVAFHRLMVRCVLCVLSFGIFRKCECRCDFDLRTFDLVCLKRDRQSWGSVLWGLSNGWEVGFFRHFGFSSRLAGLNKIGPYSIGSLIER